jgi:hypothetical protein
VDWRRRGARSDDARGSAMVCGAGVEANLTKAKRR